MSGSADRDNEAPVRFDLNVKGQFRFAVFQAQPQTSELRRRRGDGNVRLNLLLHFLPPCGFEQQHGGIDGVANESALGLSTGDWVTCRGGTQCALEPANLLFTGSKTSSCRIP